MPDFLSGAAGVSSLLGASAADDAADSQAAMGQQEFDLKREVYDDASEEFSPYRVSGQNNLAALNYELGLGELPSFGGYTPEVTEHVSQVLNPDNPTNPFEVSARGREGDTTERYNDVTSYRVDGRQFDTRELAEAYALANTTGGTPYQGYQKTPGYDYRLQQGIDSIESGAAARGGLYSGATMQALQENGQNFATNEYNNYINRLASGASAGQSAAGMQAAAGQNYASGASNALGNIGNAQAAGAIGVGNALQGGISNIIGIRQYQNQLAGQSAPLRTNTFQGIY